MNLDRFVCSKNRAHYLTSLSDDSYGRLPCVSCDGWMYPVVEEDYYGPLDKIVRKIKHWLKYGWTGRTWL